MGPTILRPGQRLIVPSARVFQPSMATPTQWWLSGGISAANCIAAYAPKGAADLASSYINLANPGTNNAAPGVAPTFSAGTGWTFNGSTQYLTTGITPTSAYSMIVRFSGAANNGYICGQLQDATSFFALSAQRGTGTIVRYAWGANTSDISTGMTSGVLAMAANNRYRNGSADGSFSSALWTGTAAIVIGAGWSAGAAFAFFGGNIQALAIYNISIASYISALTTAISNL